MRRRVLALAFVIAALELSVATAPARHSQDPQQPVFRASASAVMVDVSVRDDSRRVLSNLTASDFSILDNGVVQQVDDVSFGKLPIDVTVGLDVSYSVTGPLLDDLRRAVTQLMRDLRKGDRLKLMLFNQQVSRTVDFTTDSSAISKAMQAATAGGGTAVFDALNIALVSADDPDRRQLVMFFTDGNDAVSTTSPGTLLKTAERTRATASFVMLYAASTVPSSGLTPKPSVTITNTISTSPSVQNRTVFTVNPTLQRLAADTGGRVIPAPSSANLGSVFLGALDAFRSTYVLYYSPRGVERTGFHTISVSVNRPGAVVQARRGYFGG